MVIIRDPPQVIWIKNGEHRAFDQLANVLGVFTLTQEAFLRRKGLVPPAIPVVQFSCYRANMAMRASLAGLIEAAETGDPLKEIGITFMPKSAAPENSFNVNGLKSIIAGVNASCFSLFAERACAWVEKNVSTDRHNWPPIANFCRVVRNAIVHGGTININSAAAPTVEWRGLRISHQDCGNEVLGRNYLGPNDLMVLMFDLNEELDELNAPIDLR